MEQQLGAELCAPSLTAQVRVDGGMMVGDGLQKQPFDPALEWSYGSPT